MYVLALSDYSTISRYLQHAAAAGYKPAPQLGRQNTGTTPKNPYVFLPPTFFVSCFIFYV